jgi:hypothetical protein
MSRPGISYNVAPRYSAGSPASVDRATALRAAADELEAYQRTVDGAYGEEQRERALRLGISGIVEEREIYAHHYLATDCMTGEQRDSREPSREQLAAVERWKQRHGRYWKSALGDAWMRAGEGVLGYEPALQQLRNHCGPTWLYKAKT